MGPVAENAIKTDFSAHKFKNPALPISTFNPVAKSANQ
jgi:hypothetical protein